MTRQPLIITGSNGFIGRAIGDSFVGEFAVVGLDREPPRESSAGEWIDIDIASDTSVRSALDLVRRTFGTQVAAVVHLAAYYDFSGEPSGLYDKVTVQGTRRLLRGIEESGLQVEQFLFSSTVLVHAPCRPGERINEDWPLEPKWEYPKSKLRAERVIANHRNGIPAVLLRIVGVYDERCHCLPIAQQIQRIHERRLTGKVFPGDLSAGQSFVHLDDLVEAFRLAVERRTSLPSELPLLIGEEESLSYGELQRTLGRLIHDEEWETKRIPKLVAKSGAWVQDKVPGIEDPFIKPWMIDLADDHYALDISRARRLLGWNPKHNLRETLPSMTDFLKSDPDAFYRENKLEGSPQAFARETVAHHSP